MPCTFNRPQKIEIILILCVIVVYKSFAQNFEKINKRDALKVNGGLSYSSVAYDAHGIANRRQPYTWFLNGNVTANFLDISLPFTFNYSNNQMAYTQPFNFQCFNPTYKWVKGYAGITSMNFSQYTLAGHMFAGGGLELSPKNFKIAAMYGRLKKANEFDAQTNSDENMSYKRMGTALSVGYEKNGHAFKVIYFSAKDDPSSLKFVPVNPRITPMENTVVSFLGKTLFFKKIKLDIEYALSGLTRNITSPNDLNTYPKNQLPYIFKPNATSQFFGAFKSSLSYNYKFFGIGINYERIEPDYKTLGAYYFNNDLENITLSPSINLLKGKLNVSLNSGLQKNNLNQAKLNTTKRWVGSINFSYMPNKKWNINGSYSNFSSYTKQRPQDDPFYKNALDTLNFYQLAQSSMIACSYRFGKTKTNHSILLSLNYQVTGQRNRANSESVLFLSGSRSIIPNKVVNGNLGHNIMFAQSKTTLGISVNSNYNILPEWTNLYIGPNLNLSKSFYKNIFRIAVGASYNKVFTNAIITNELANYRLSANYNPKFNRSDIGQFGLVVSLVYLQKLNTDISPSFSEMTVNFGINYNF